MPDWTKGKKQRVCILLGLIILLAASFLTFDWTQYYFGLVRISDPELIYTRLAKTLTSFLIFLLALSVGQDGIDEADPIHLRIGYFPRTNALLIAVGATCLFVGDYLVGFNLSLEPSLQRAMTLFLTWAFYAPAITLLALSGYRWAKQGERSA